jgi:quinol monooxygenase YgiN
MRLLFPVVLTMAMLTMAMMPMALAPKAAAEEADQTAYMVTYVEVTPAAKGQAATMLKQLAAASKQDVGLVRFEVLQRTAPSNQFVILEAWKDQAALDAHGATAHAKQFRDKVTPLLIAPIDDRLSIAISTVPPQNARAGLYVVTHVDVGPPNRDKIVVALNALADPTRRDAGNVRFDVLQQKARSNHFTVTEAWKDQRSNDAHEIAAHTKDFRAALGPLTGALYDQRWSKPL